MFPAEIASAGAGTRAACLRVLPWIAGVATLLLAVVFRSPLFLPWRAVALIWLSIAATVVIVRLLGRKNAGTPHSRWLAILWTAACLIAASQQSVHLWHKHAVLSAEGENAEHARRFGAHLVIGFTDLATVTVLAERGFIGGIFVGANNVRGRDAGAVRAEIDALQAARARQGLPPLIVTTDQEGGIVSRVSPPLTHQPSLAETLADTPLEKIATRSYAYGQRQGRELNALGINVNLAPLADLSSPAQRQHFDFRSLIGQRAIDTDPERVRRAVIGYAHGLESQGLLATLKHFPGLGSVRGDTHIVPAALAADPEHLERHDWFPFRAALRETGSLLMVGHATLTAIDPDKPASLSHRVVRQIVRDGWQHDGILITDDLSMGAVARHGLCSAGVDAIAAGIDLLLVSYDIEQYFTVLHCLMNGGRDNDVNSALLDKSDRRLERLGDTLGKRHERALWIDNQGLGA